MNAARPSENSDAVLVYRGNIATVRQLDGGGSEMLTTLKSAAGDLHLCSRFPAPISARQAAVLLRLSMVRNGALEQ